METKLQDEPHLQSSLTSVTSTPKPVETSTPKPVETSTPKPVETSTPKPVETSTPKPVETSTPKPVENIEINQNYLKPSADDITERSLQDVKNEKEYVNDEVKYNDEESSGILSVEKKEKACDMIVPGVRKRSSFMVSAILDKEICDVDDKLDDIVDKNKTLYDVHVFDRIEKKGNSNNNKPMKKVLEIDATSAEDNYTNALTSTTAAHVSDQNNVVNNSRKLEDNEQSSHIQCTKNAHQFASSLYTQINDKTNNNHTETKDDVENVFPTIFGSLTNTTDNTNDSQCSSFESKINEIKKRKLKEVNQTSEIIEEKRVRKRKQERPQPINFKKHQVEVDVSNENLEQSVRKSKRKQIVTKRHFQYDSAESQDSNEIKQTPLCSKLCKPDSKKRSLFQKRMIERVPDFEETSQSQGEDSNIPCTTNRYRRHFLKQLRKAEAARSKRSNISQTHGENDITNEEYDSEDDYLFDGKRIKISELEESLDSNKCKVCSKEFNDIGMLMAHYICHSSMEKYKANHDTNNTTGVASNTSKPLGSNGDADDTLKTTESKNTYFCHLCSDKFPDIVTLQAHVLEHSGNLKSQQQQTGVFECNFCQKTFATQGSLYLHKKIHTGDNPYSCLECHKQFRDKTRLTTHMRVHTGEKPYSCEFCGKTFSQKGNLKLHQQKIHFGLKRGKYRCKHCGVYFTEKKNFTEHLKAGHAGDGDDSKLDDGKVGESSKDDTGASTENGVDLEKAKHGMSADDYVKAELAKLIGKTGQDKGISANSVNVSVESRSDENSNTSVSEKSLVIDDDPTKLGLKDFKGIFGSESSDSKETGSLTDTTTKAAKFTCPICSFPYQTATSFNRHFQTHGASMLPFRPAGVGAGYSMIAQSGSEFPSGVKKVYRCEECSLDFVSFPEFQCHLKSHKDNNAKVMCNICQKQMSSSNLLDHMRIHTGEKPYGCIHCGKLFRRSHHLQTHLRTHTGDRPYHCVDCGKTFARGDHLQNHRRTHTGEKPYKCEICEKSYSQSHHLLRHKRTHTGEKPYNCELCEKRFSRDHHLKKHMETHRVVIYTQATDTTSQTNRQDSPKIELPSVPMSTRGSDRIAQLLSSTWYNNIASGVMTDIVNKHLSSEREQNGTGEIMAEKHKITQGEQLSKQELAGEVMAEKHKITQGEQLSEHELAAGANTATPADDTLASHNNGPSAVPNKTSLIDDSLVSQKLLPAGKLGILKGFEEYKEMYLKLHKGVNNDKAVEEELHKLIGLGDAKPETIVDKH